MHICFIDNAFTWPPVGGANVDFLNVVQRLSRFHRCTVLQPVLRCASGVRTMWATGDGSPALRKAGCDVIRVAGPWYRHVPELIARQLQAHLTRLQPDLIWLGDLYFLKPWLATLLTPWPVLLRFYAFEALCPNYNERFHWHTGSSCSTHLLDDNASCRACFWRRLRTDHVRDMFKLEYLTCRAFLPSYAARFRHALHRAAAVIVSNRQVRDMLHPYAPHITVIPGGFSPDVFAPRAAVPPSPRPLTILCAGRLADSAKGLAILLAACDRLTAAGRKLHVRLAGDFPAAVQRPYLTFLGWLDEASFARALTECDVFVAPSLWEEPFGLTVVEAMACGIPVIASDNAGHRSSLEAVAPELLYPPNDSDGLARRLAELADAPARRELLGRRCANYAAEHYAWDAVISRHYQPLLHRIGRQ